MPKPMSRRQREDAFLELAQRMYAELEMWYDAHPNASFGEIEAETRRRRRDLMGETIAILINGRVTGYQPKSPTCSQCGQPMEFEGYRTWRVNGLEGDTPLERAYYVCPTCDGQTVFPPGSATASAGGSLE